MKKKKLETDNLLREKYISARKGLPVYTKFIKKYGTLHPKLSERGEQSGKKHGFHSHRPTVFVFQPDGYSDDAVYSLSCLKLLTLSVNPRLVVFITTNPEMADYVRLFDQTAVVEVISEDTAQDILNLSLMIPFDEFFYIASTTKPFGRWGDKLLKNRLVGAEKCFAVGVYRVWFYSPEPLPIYEGDDTRLHSFVNRARRLQEASILVDKEAQNRYA